MNDSQWLQRGVLALGCEKSDALANAHVLVIGLGGVGSWAAEMLCRAGVGRLSIIDADRVDVTNVNRQMPALHSTVGQYKSDVVAARLRDINPSLVLNVKNVYVDEENIHTLLDTLKPHFVVDAIDTLPSKAALIVACWQRGIKIVSSMGAGAKSDLSKIRTGELWRTENCVLARNLRRLLREWRGKYKLPVVFSAEEANKAAVAPNPAGGKPIIGSLGYYTAVFGCYLTEYVIRNI